MIEIKKLIRCQLQNIMDKNLGIHHSCLTLSKRKQRDGGSKTVVIRTFREQHMTASV